MNIKPSEEYKKIIKSKNYELSQQAKATIISESQNYAYEPLRKALISLASK